MFYGLTSCPLHSELLPHVHMDFGQKHASSDQISLGNSFPGSPLQACCVGLWAHFLLLVCLQSHGFLGKEEREESSSSGLKMRNSWGFLAAPKPNISTRIHRLVKTFKNFSQLFDGTIVAPSRKTADKETHKQVNNPSYKSWVQMDQFLLMALIGEQFDESDEICGVVVNVRQRQDKLALWTKTASNEAAQIYYQKTFWEHGFGVVVLTSQLLL